MNRWKSASALLTVALVASVSFGQTTTTPEQMQKQIDQLTATVQSLAKSQADTARENAELKSRVDGVQQDSLETEVNRLTDRLAAATAVNSKASQITLGGEFRYRDTYALGDNLGGDEHNGNYGDARVRINFLYNFTKDVSAFAELQTAWAHGDNTEGPVSAVEFGGATDVNLYQGWLRIGNIFGRSEFSSKIGRQEIMFGNQFQFGNADWFDGVVFDGGRWDWECTGFSLTALALKLSSSDFGGDIDQYYAWQGNHDDDELYGLYFTLKSIKNHTIDLYWLYVNGHGGSAINGGTNAGFGNNADLGGGGITGFLYPGSQAYFHTLGARIGGWFDVAAGLDYNLEGAYQFGDIHNLTVGGGDADVEAFTIEAEVGLTFSASSKFRVFGRFLFAEGPSDNDVGYLTLYGNRHSNTASFRARYGLMDVIPMSNVVTGQLGLHFDPATDWTLGATGLWAGSDEEGSNNAISGTDDDGDYGWEFDIWGEYRYSEHLTFGAGLALLFPDDQGQFLWGLDDDTQFLGYVQARLVF